MIRLHSAQIRNNPDLNCYTIFIAIGCSCRVYAYSNNESAIVATLSKFIIDFSVSLIKMINENIVHSLQSTFGLVVAIGLNTPNDCNGNEI